MCLYVCLCVCIYACVCVCVHVYMYSNVRACQCVLIAVCGFIVSTCSFTCACICVYAWHVASILPDKADFLVIRVLSIGWRLEITLAEKSEVLGEGCELILCVGNIIL